MFSSSFIPRYRRRFSYVIIPTKKKLAKVPIRIFIDKNFNGIYDFGDVPLQGVCITINNRKYSKCSDARGKIEVYLPHNQKTLIGISVDTIYDPYLRPRGYGYVYVYPRTANTKMVMLPLIESGSIEGYLVNVNGSPAFNVPMRLIDMYGNIVSKTISSPVDGFFLFEFVPPGRYYVKPVWKGYSVLPETITVEKNNLFVRTKLVLRKLVSLKGDKNKKKGGK